jgi:aerobic carbon-monoxide dehydrogenase small subunit
VNDRELRFTLNGEPVVAATANDETLLEVLRERFGQGGVRESCGVGVCGTCTVSVDGRAVSSCLSLAFQADGATVVTAEGLSPSANELHPVAQAFIDEFAFQCGFCTPGAIVMASHLLEEDPDPSVEAIRAYLGGNLCRCGCYPEIIAAVQRAAAAVRDRQGAQIPASALPTDDPRGPA